MVARVIREAVRYAKNNAPKRVSAKNSRKAANEAKKRGTIRRTEEVKPKRKPPVKDVVPKSKAAKKSLLRKYGVPASIIAGVLTGSTLLNKKDKKPAAKKEAKKETPMKRRFRAGPTAGSGLGGQRRSGTLRGKNVVANPPKRKNKDTAKKPRRPSRPSMTGFRK